MNEESERNVNWNRRSLLEEGAAPAIRGHLIDDREPDPGSLTKVE